MRGVENGELYILNILFIITIAMMIVTLFRPGIRDDAFYNEATPGGPTPFISIPCCRINNKCGPNIISCKELNRPRGLNESTTNR